MCFFSVVMKNLIDFCEGIQRNANFRISHETYVIQSYDTTEQKTQSGNRIYGGGIQCLQKLVQSNKWRGVENYKLVDI